MAAQCIALNTTAERDILGCRVNKMGRCIPDIMTHFQATIQQIMPEQTPEANLEEAIAGREEARLIYLGVAHGLTVSHSQFQKHGAYLLENSDLSGFSRQEQRVLSAMVRGHRRKFPNPVFESLPSDLVTCTKQLCILLRLSVLNHRARPSAARPIPRLEVEEKRISLVFPEEWIKHHPLTRAELEQEGQYLESAGYLLRFS